MDPLSSLINIYFVIKVIKKSITRAKENAAKFSQMNHRLQRILPILNVLESNPHIRDIPDVTKSMDDLLLCVIDIKEFIFEIAEKGEKAIGKNIFSMIWKTATSKDISRKLKDFEDDLDRIIRDLNALLGAQQRAAIDHIQEDIGHLRVTLDNIAVATISDTNGNYQQSHNLIASSLETSFVRDPMPKNEDDDRSVIGEGAFGVIHRMRNTADNAFYAVKVIRVKAAINQGTNLDKLTREASVLRVLNHPNIVRYYTSFYSKSESFFNIVMELVDGGSLADRIKSKSGSMTIANITDWLIQITDALQYMHTIHCIQHRDLKPENILISSKPATTTATTTTTTTYASVVKQSNGLTSKSFTPASMKAVAAPKRNTLSKSTPAQKSNTHNNSSSNNSGIVKIIDLGLASVVRTSEGDPSTGVGSVVYSSYEKAVGLKYDGRDDLFALGIILGELLTKSRLSARGGPIYMYTEERICERREAFIRDAKSVDEHLGNIVETLLQPLQEMRPTSSMLQEMLKLNRHSMDKAKDTKIVHKYPNGDVYEGEMKGNRRHGIGKFTTLSGYMYEGDWYDDRRSGRGTEITPIGDVYDGEWKNDEKHGHGVFTYPDGGWYEGSWRNDLRHGKGKFTSDDGRVYEGDYKDGAKDGRGSYAWPDGKLYIGEFKDGRMHGIGTYSWPDGYTYEGEWNNDRREGKGKYSHPSGRIYEGEWKNDAKSGSGVYRGPDGSTYQGQYSSDLKHGQGKYTTPDGTVYHGEYRLGRRHGLGKQTWTSSTISKSGARHTITSVYEGEFKNDCKNGWGTYTWPDGRSYEGEWLDDEKHGKGKIFKADGRILFEGNWSRGNFIPVTTTSP